MQQKSKDTYSNGMITLEGPPFYSHSSTEAASQLGLTYNLIARESGTMVPEMMFLYNKGSEMGSPLPSIST